ncbi:MULTISPECIES: MFS transporter [Paenibacillus]|uniref:MFS transporter n=1 Tax=Paenibacillus TaxID=44249 RepID=UPI0022B8F4B7|nr:MFS transporter [Paenibacillus caseinilyticus]MCZ8520943.1 MFS transporter [Paenibacillus caseinilyticus]
MNGLLKAAPLGGGRKSKAVLWNVLLIMFGFQMMLNMSRPAITLFASELGAGTLQIGMLTSSYALLPLLLAIHAGKLADRFGDRLPVLIGSIGCAFGMAMPYLFPSLWALYVSQFAVGVSHVFIAICLQNVLGHAAQTKDERDSYFSMLSMSVALAGFIGPVAQGYLSEQVSYAAVFLIAMFFCIIPVAVVRFIPIIKHRGIKEAAVSEPEGSSSALGLLRIPLLRNALATSALVLYSRDIFVAYFPLYGARMGISESNIGWILALQGLAMVFVRLFLPALTKLLGRERVLLGSILTAGLGFVLIPYASSVWLLLMTSVLMGIGLGCGQPLSMSTTYNASPKNKTGEVLGLRLATNRLSQLVAPLFFGLVGTGVGLVSVFYVSGAFLIGGALLTKSKPQEEPASVQ